MNNWGYHPTAIVESDDFQDKYDRNGLEMLFYWKAKYPEFKISLFTIPNKTSDGMIELIDRNSDWIELLVHGWDHDSNYECWGWDYEKTEALMKRIYVSNYGDYRPFFKAPGWMITDKYGGYTATEELPISKDPQCVYKALRDLDFVVFDRHYNAPARPDDLNCVCVDCNPQIIHMHTWDMVTGDLNSKNGFRQVEELHGVPWDKDTEFYFVSEAWGRRLFNPCTK